jgi:hypothetical protein
METQLATRMPSCGAHGPGNWQINFTKTHIQIPWKTAMSDTKAILERA